MKLTRRFNLFWAGLSIKCLLFRNKYKVKPTVSRSLTGEDKQHGKRIHKITVLFRKNKEDSNNNLI